MHTCFPVSSCIHQTILSLCVWLNVFGWERGGGGGAAMTYLCIHLFPFLTVSARIALRLCRSEVLCDSFVKTQKWWVLFILSTKWNESVPNQQRLHWSLSHILYTSKSCSQTVAESLAHSHIHTGKKKKRPNYSTEKFCQDKVNEISLQYCLFFPLFLFRQITVT